MPTGIEPDIIKFRDRVFRYRPGRGSKPELVLMLHGWTGDENSMWFFTRAVPEKKAILSPRAPYPAPEGGYTWRPIVPGTWGYPTLEELRQPAEDLINFITDWCKSEGIDSERFDLVGFSQGAALCHTITFLFPERVRSLAALSGFIPRGVDNKPKGNLLAGKPVFIAHGRQDDMVPVEQAREAAALLQKVGARVRYCESDGGHRVSKECLEGLAAFYTNSNQDRKPDNEIA